MGEHLARRRVRPVLTFLLGFLPATAAPQATQDDPSRLSVHGYLSQAYGVAHDATVLGIPEEGTTDYRTLALQFRYGLSDKDTLVVQLSHERFGLSPFARLKDDVEVDWAFYERRFSDAFALRAGKVQIPLGIYNEIRDVGTLLPFYRPPFNFYGEGAYTSETVDGLVASVRPAPRSQWSPSLDVYYGGWDLIEVNPLTAEASIGRAKDDLGFQLWIETPLDGLRVGGGAARFTLRDQLLAPPASKVSVSQWHASVDGSFERLTTRFEIARIRFRPGSYRVITAHVGIRLFSKLTAHGQLDTSRLDYSVPGGPRFDRTFNEDWALGLAWAFRSNLVLKLEGHRTEGFRVDEPVDVFTAAPIRARYALLSLSASF